MSPFDPLSASLADLLNELAPTGISITVAGGFGLFLKKLHSQEQRLQTLFQELPVSRATNDIDLFLRAEVVADPHQVQQITEALDRLGYSPVQEAKYLQWTKPVTIGGVVQAVKLDVLVGPTTAVRKKLKISKPRVRPKGKDIRFHAYEVDEAIRIEQSPLDIQFKARRSSGDPFEGKLFLAHPFPYLLMKLHAFSDRKDDVRKDEGRHHALDLYTIIGLLTEPEYRETLRLGTELGNEKPVQRAREIVSADFSGATAMGVLRLREHPLYRAEFQLDPFLELLAEIFPRP